MRRSGDFAADDSKSDRLLASANARGLYQGFGFSAPAKPETLMEINVPDIYQK